MNSFEIVFIACLLVTSCSGQDDTTTAAAETTTIPTVEVCDQACALVQVQIVSETVKFNLNDEKMREGHIVVTAIVTAVSGQLLTFKQLFTSQLSGSEEETAERDFIEYIKWALGDELKVTGQLAAVLSGSYTVDQQVELLVSGIYNETREETITSEAYAQLFVSSISALSTLSGKISAIYQSTYQANFQGSGRTSRHAGHVGFATAHQPAARHHGHREARHHNARHHGQKKLARHQKHY